MGSCTGGDHRVEVEAGTWSRETPPQTPLAAQPQLSLPLGTSKSYLFIPPALGRTLAFHTTTVSTVAFQFYRR